MLNVFPFVAIISIMYTINWFMVTTCTYTAWGGTLGQLGWTLNQMDAELPGKQPCPYRSTRVGFENFIPTPELLGIVELRELGFRFQTLFPIA